MLAAACGGGDSTSSSSSPSSSPQGSPAASGAAASSSPGANPLPSGVLEAVPPDNAGTFLAQFHAVEKAVPCSYDPQSSILDCTKDNLGRIHLKPPVVGKNLTCYALLNGDKLIGATCHSEDPLFGAPYKLADLPG